MPRLAARVAQAIRDRDPRLPAVGRGLGAPTIAALVLSRRAVASAFSAFALALAFALEALVDRGDGGIVAVALVRQLGLRLRVVQHGVRRQGRLASQEKDVLCSRPDVVDEGLEGLGAVVGPPHELLSHLARESFHEVVLKLVLRDLAANVDPILHDGLELH